MITARWFGGALFTFMVVALTGCAAVGVTQTNDPERKLIDAGHLLDQGRALPSERLIHEAIETYRTLDDAHNLGYAYGLYAELLQSNAVNKAELAFLRSGFRDPSVNMANRFEKSIHYTRMAIEQYTRAVERHTREEKYGALTNAHFQLAWLHERLLDKAKACSHFQKTKEAYALNKQKNPQAKPYTPKGYRSISDFVTEQMRKLPCP